MELEHKEVLDEIVQKVLNDLNNIFLKNAALALSEIQEEFWLQASGNLRYTTKEIDIND